MNAMSEALWSRRVRRAEPTRTSRSAWNVERAYAHGRATRASPFRHVRCTSSGMYCCVRGRLTLFVTTALFTAAAFAITGCLDRPTVEELISKPVIVTKRDSSTDFASLTTFAMTDTIPLLETLDAGPSTMSVDPAVANPTLDEISAQLSSRGYRRVALAAGPDFGVVVTAISRLRIVSFGYGGYWGAGAASASYWGYSGAGLDSSIAYQTIAWQSGTLVIELYDLRAVREEAQRSSVTPTVAAPALTAPITLAWAGIIHGVVGEAGASLPAPPIAEVQQAFTQSPYLVRSQAPSEVQ